MMAVPLLGSALILMIRHQDQEIANRNIRQVALEEGLQDAFQFPGFVPAYIRPLFCRGIGPFRWCALSAVKIQRPVRSPL